MTISWLAERKATTAAKTAITPKFRLGSHIPRARIAATSGIWMVKPHPRRRPRGIGGGKTVNERRPQEFQGVETADQRESPDGGTFDAHRGEPGGKGQIVEHERQAAGKTEREYLEYMAIGIRRQRTTPAADGLFRHVSFFRQVSFFQHARGAQEGVREPSSRTTFSF